MSKQIVMDKLPTCDIPGCGRPARYDTQLRAFGGPVWGYTCPWHWEAMRYSTKLGTGHGQRMVLAHEGDRIGDKQAAGKAPFPKGARS